MDEYQFIDASSASHVLKNFSSVLKSVLEKLESPLEFDTRVIEVINGLTYRATPEIRSLFSESSESSLSDLRLAYASRCLISRGDSLENRITSLDVISSSIESIISIGDPKTLSNTHVVLLLLDFFIRLTDRIQTGGNINFFVTAQTKVLVLLRSATSSSIPCRRTVVKIFAKSIDRSSDLSSSSRSTSSPTKCSRLHYLLPVLIQKSAREDILNTAAPTQSSWFSWGSNPSENVLSALSQVESLEFLSSKDYDDDMVIPMFLDWLNSHEASDFRSTFAERIGQEFLQVGRYIEKTEELNTIRFTKFHNQSQEKMTKDKNERLKIIKSLSEKIRFAVEPICTSFQSTLARFSTDILDKVNIGGAAYMAATAAVDKEGSEEMPLGKSPIQEESIKNVSAFKNIRTILEETVRKPKPKPNEDDKL